MTFSWFRGEGPKGLPDWINIYLVANLEVDPDSISLAEYVEQFDFIDGRPVLLIRVFDQSSAKEDKIKWLASRYNPPNLLLSTRTIKKPPATEAKIKNFASLDDYPELILYEGYRDIESGTIHLSANYPVDQP